MGKRYCLGHGRNVRNVGPVQHLPMLHRRWRGFMEFVDLDDDSSDDLGDGEGWAEVVGGAVPGDSNGGDGAN